MYTAIRQEDKRQQCLFTGYVSFPHYVEKGHACYWAVFKKDYFRSLNNIRFRVSIYISDSLHKRKTFIHSCFPRVLIPLCVSSFGSTQDFCLQASRWRQTVWQCF
ncbi:hypothetical protein CEXT_740961 [Caerostris extrusa]|uniref:Uncharacterized protein n=1 Tax=Caerostris extrusa TaxID=172846 RepID=A0AAV4XM41_CAEEX|nr:hypothetical protein CEXT_740961 [Caerostris extrusa]